MIISGTVTTRMKSGEDGAQNIYGLMASFSKAKGDALYAHQRYAVNHLIENPRKSALICYAMGTGKTAIAAEYVVKHFRKKVVYMGPKSLHPVFIHHISSVGGDPREQLVGEKKGILRYGTITSEASNVYDQMVKQIEPILGRLDEKRVLDHDESGEPIGESPSVLVIMDECHIFSARVAKILSMIHYSDDETKQIESEEKQAYRLYRLLCRDPRIRVIAMTGTPIKTHPFNFVPIANIIRKEFAGADGKRSVAFPEVFGRFHDSFVRDLLVALRKESDEATSLDRKSESVSDKKAPDLPKAPEPTLYIPSDDVPATTIKTRDPGDIDLRKLETFSIRMRGLVLWYEAPKGLKSVPFPVVESEEYVEIPMEPHQWKVYRKMEEEEARIESAFKKDRPERTEGAPRLDDPSVYRALTRQASNFAFPEDMYIGRNRSAAEMLQMMPPETFQLTHIGKYSCKIERIMKSIVDLPDRIHGIFSSFVHGAGLAVIEKCLDALGWKSLNEILRKKAMTFQEVVETAGKGVTLYMSLTGDTQPELKERLISILNQPENTHKLLVRAILYSGAAAHGLTFKSGRVIHFLEPEWDDVEEEQARDRFIRINAASFLPENQRKIKIFYYLAVHPDPTSKEETTDQHLRKVAERKTLLNSMFLTWLKCAAVNCEGMYKAENNLHSAMIKSGEVPPFRTFFRCVSCEAKYIQSYFLQELTDGKCKHTAPTDPGKVVIDSVGGKKISLDPETGLGWIVSKQKSRPLFDSVLLRLSWIKALEKKVRV